jgi:hypothetical protein
VHLVSNPVVKVASHSILQETALSLILVLTHLQCAHGIHSENSSVILNLKMLTFSSGRHVRSRLNARRTSKKALPEIVIMVCLDANNLDSSFAFYTGEGWFELKAVKSSWLPEAQEAYA